MNYFRVKRSPSRNSVSCALVDKDKMVSAYFFTCLVFISSEFQEQVRSGDASATEYFELGAVMLRRKFYPAATKYLLQAIEKWDGDDQDLAQV